MTPRLASMRRSRTEAIQQVAFIERPPMEAHSRYPQFKGLIGSPDFCAYREVFERGWVEPSLMAGECVRLEHLQVAGDVPTHSFARLMGVNSHLEARIEMAEELFSLYEALGSDVFFSEAVFKTAYAQRLLGQGITENGRISALALLKGTSIRRRIRRRVSEFITLYENMKQSGCLVAQARKPSSQVGLTSLDIPWAIDYLGYIKLRDGAHRRAAAAYLRWETIPTLVFEFGKVGVADLERAHPYIRENFPWFSQAVETLERSLAQSSV